MHLGLFYTGFILKLLELKVLLIAAIEVALKLVVRNLILLLLEIIHFVTENIIRISVFLFLVSGKLVHLGPFALEKLVLVELFSVAVGRRVTGHRRVFGVYFTRVTATGVLQRNLIEH